MGVLGLSGRRTSIVVSIRRRFAALVSYISLLIHKNMELYQNIPNMTVKFERRFNDHFDEYVIIFSPALPLLNELRASMGAIDAQPRRMLFATGSRPFLDLHYQDTRIDCLSSH